MIDEKALRAAFAVNHHPESEPSETELAKLRAAITVYLQALSPEGWVLVPKEPTKGMIEAAEAFKHAGGAGYTGIFRAMLSAAGERG